MADRNVVHCKRAPYDIYIGRPGPWGNPFQIPRDGDREAVIRKYRRWLSEQVNTGAITLEQLAALDGKVLGCWCAPQACHGDVLVRAAAWARGELQKGEG